MIAWLWIVATSRGAALWEETVIALGAIAAAVAEVLVLRAFRGEAEEVARLRADLAGLREEVVGLRIERAEASASFEVLKARVDDALGSRVLERLAALERADDEEGGE